VRLTRTSALSCALTAALSCSNSTFFRAALANGESLRQRIEVDRGEVDVRVIALTLRPVSNDLKPVGRDGPIPAGH
jgi:hypothetical protein